VTVLRDGEHIITDNLSALSIDEIIRHMVGRKLTEHYPKQERTIGDEILRVEGLSKKGICDNVSFSLRKGEILGLAGLVGAGRTEIMQLLYGYRKKIRAVFSWRERSHHPFHQGRGTAGHRTDSGGTKKQGLVLGLSVLDNSALTILDLHSIIGFLKEKTSPNW